MPGGHHECFACVFRTLEAVKFSSSCFSAIPLLFHTQEKVARQLFRQLATSLVHWLTASAKRYAPASLCSAVTRTVLDNIALFLAARSLRMYVMGVCTESHSESEVLHQQQQQCQHIAVPFARREAAEPMALLDAIIDGLVSPCADHCCQFWGT